ncbi:MAG: ligase-associated DNA damage response exonuclease [Alphaproteobacteria bacterium]|nr:ligase-associated DNA damage response exonuclease [Alphaproteobacteria bacterium]
MTDVSPESWMQVRPEGLYCKPADAFVDPHRPVGRAIVTHGHADHARSGHETVFATAETVAIMRTRYTDDAVTGAQPMTYGERKDLGNGVTLWLAPAGHILGSAQAVIEFGGRRIVISGDYKRHFDPTCAPFELVPCDVFVTEATFALPVFSHPPIEHEMAKLMRSMASLPDRTHLVGVYALGKCQRVMAALREAGYPHPFFLHGALVRLTQLYEGLGYDFGSWQEVSKIDRSDRDQFRGRVVLCPPSALADRWSRSLPDPLPIMASGWMQIRARARQRRAEMALIVSDHADWADLLETARETGAGDVWITHGRVEALEHALKQQGIRAKALDLVGREEEPE